MTEISGGTASNIVPVPCSFGWEIRRLPGFDGMALDKRLRTFAAEHCLPEMQRAAPETSITIDIVNEVPAFLADPKSGIVHADPEARPAERHLRRLLRHRGQPVPEGRRALRRHRPRQHRPGAHAQRVRRGGRAREVPGLPRPRRGLGRELDVYAARNFQA